MRDTPGHRSLYWRIASGLFASLGLMVVAEAGLFFLITQQAAGAMPAQSPRRLALIVASDLSSALTANGTLDLEEYVRDQYAQIYQPFVVILRDGRTFSNHADAPDELLDAARNDVGPPWSLPAGRRGGGRFGGGRGGRRGGEFGGNGGRDDAGSDVGSRPGAGTPGLAGPAGRPGGVAPIIVDGMPVGRVAVLPGPSPLALIARELGPTIGLAAGAVLIGGAGLIALLVFAPVRTRIKSVQTAAERLRGGDLNARAPEDGSDEVAALARSFNEMAKELARRTKALESSDAARRTLLADVSHELMTPLTAMRGYIETLGMAEVQLDDPTRQRYLGVVGEETRRLERLIGDLLDLARLEGGGVALRRDVVPVRLLTERVAARHERELSARGIRLTTAITHDAGHVVGDAHRLEQALQNLAANALRHTPEGGTIAITTSRSGSAVSIAVHDTGPGIPEQHLPLIFDRFYKADAARRASGGSGLGLSIARAIVEAHGGRIRAHNDGGAVFTIELPSPVSGPDAESSQEDHAVSPGDDDRG